MAAWPRSLMGIVKNFDTLFDRLETTPMGKLLFGLLCLYFSPVTALAGEIMFEGYYRVEAESKHIGYIVQRYEFDSKAKQFTFISFMRIKLGDKIIQESTKGKANDKFHPISYNYTSQVNEAMKAIDATFTGQVMKIKITDGKTIKDPTYKIPEGTFLSSFLIYVMLQKKLPLNQAFKYSAVVEEDGDSRWGKALLETKEQKGSVVQFSILNAFKEGEFRSKLLAVPDPNPKEKDKYIKAEIIFTEDTKQSLTTRLVASPAEATEGQMVPNKIMTTLFGGMPTGKVNMVANPPKEK